MRSQVRPSWGRGSQDHCPEWLLGPRTLPWRELAGLASPEPPLLPPPGSEPQACRARQTAGEFCGCLEAELKPVTESDFAPRSSELPIHGGIQAEANCGEVPTAHGGGLSWAPSGVHLGRSPDDTSRESTL